MGIAEADMMGFAAGLAACGKKPFANSFAMFTAGRAWEQVRNSIAYPHLNVKCVGSHGGLSVGEDGATHQCVEDLALMSAIPGMVVVNPCDGPEMRKAVKALLDYEGPAYLRLGRMAVESVTDETPGYEFTLGKAALLRDGSDVTLAATGLMVQRALAAADILAAKGLSARVLDIHTIKPLDTEAILAAARGHRLHRHQRGAQHHRRPGQRRGRSLRRKLPRAGGAPRRDGRVRPQRQGPGGARALRPHRRGHGGEGRARDSAEKEVSR